MEEDCEVVWLSSDSCCLGAGNHWLDLNPRKARLNGSFNPKPNNSFNVSGNRVVLIENLDDFVVVCAPG
jgi:hypothetical protein